MPNFNPRREFCRGSGIEESDQDYVDNNLQLAVELLDAQADPWTSVADALPPLDPAFETYSQDVLARTHSMEVRRGYYCTDTLTWLDHNDYQLFDVTHWQPLPEALL